MKIADLILDYIAETGLFEMAKSRQDAKRLITDLSPQVFTHLIKLFVLHSPENKNHWIKEIDSWLRQIDDLHLKPSNNKPKWQDIYNWMIFDSAPHYDRDFITARVDRRLKRDYPDLPVHDYDADAVLNQILKIIEHAAKDIAADKFDTVNQYLP